MLMKVVKTSILVDLTTTTAAVRQTRTFACFRVTSSFVRSSRTQALGAVAIRHASARINWPSVPFAMSARVIGIAMSGLTPRPVSDDTATRPGC
jgi:hypothetical protein